MNKKVLIIAAHPDDEVLGCGGVIKRTGAQVLILSQGVASRYERLEQAPTEKMEEMKAAAQEAGKVLGATEVSILDFPDNRFDTVALIDIVKRIEEHIERIKPEAIFTHHAGDLNIDHRITHQAVLTATRPKPRASVKEIYAFEVPSSTDWAFDQLKPFSANVFFDISQTLDAKVAALECYKSEISEFPHPRSKEAIVANAKRWGSVVGVEAAEAFELIRKLEK